MNDDLERFVRKNQEAFDREEPPTAVLGKVLAQVLDKKPKKAGLLIPFQTIRWAAACLVLFVIGIAFLVFQMHQNERVLQKASELQVRQPFKQATGAERQSQNLVLPQNASDQQSVALIDQDITLHQEALASRIRIQKQVSQKKIIFAELVDMESPATRINAVSEAYYLKINGTDVIDALIETLNTDPSANVRLAALDGLSRFYKEKYVRDRLIASLKNQKDPVVKIAIINLLTRIKEAGILSELDKLINDEEELKAVKDCAYSSRLQLKDS